MRILVAALIILAAHFSLTAFVPGGKALFYWPWGSNTRTLVKGLGGLPRDDAVLTSVLAWWAGLAFFLAFLALFQIMVPEIWFPIFLLSACVSSILLFALHFSVLALLPVLIDVVLLFGVLVQHWTPPNLL
jgi:hypothetical protein